MRGKVPSTAFLLLWTGLRNQQILSGGHLEDCRPPLNNPVPGYCILQRKQVQIQQYFQTIIIKYVQQPL